MPPAEATRRLGRFRKMLFSSRPAPPRFQAFRQGRRAGAHPESLRSFRRSDPARERPDAIGLPAQVDPPARLSAPGVRLPVFPGTPRDPEKPVLVPLRTALPARPPGEGPLTPRIHPRASPQEFPPPAGRGGEGG